MSTPSLTRMQEILARVRAAKSSAQSDAGGVVQTLTSAQSILPTSSDQITQTTEIPTIPPALSADQITDKYGNLITLNSKQMEFVNYVSSGRSAVLIGAAGTGKTTCQKAAVQELIHAGLAGILEPQGHKHLPANTPGIVITAYTRRATANIRRNVSAEMQGNCITIHKLLEYQPVYNDVYDSESGETRTKMSFEATRNANNPLPSSIRIIILEEASMVGTDLFQEIVDACPHGPQFIFLGDIQQLPPVFGSAILGFKLLELHVVELTEVYRQALESPIISLAHRILSGKAIRDQEFPDWKRPALTIHPWKKRIESMTACNTAGQFFIAAENGGGYDPEEDMILCPFNKAFGTDELNKKIANHLSHKRGATVYEIIAGFNKHYFSVGDKVLFDKLDAQIVDIRPNLGYAGQKTAHPSPTMDYWGFDPESEKYRGMADSSDDFDVDFMLSSAASSDERTAQSSHIIKIKFLDSDGVQELNKAAEINSMSLGYVLTVHKSQGSEWRKVFLVIHQSHNTMIQRELLYTAVTRAREELYVICEPDHFVKGIESQRIKGNTLAEKAEYFKGKISKEDEKLS